MPVRVRRILLAVADDDAELRVVVAGEVLGRAVENEIRTVLERAQEDGRRRCGVDEHPRGMSARGFEVGHRQEGIRRRLEPDEVGALGRGSCLVELDDA